MGVDAGCKIACAIRVHWHGSQSRTGANAQRLIYPTTILHVGKTLARTTVLALQALWRFRSFRPL